jgi:hypothetical protein
MNMTTATRTLSTVLDVAELGCLIAGDWKESMVRKEPKYDIPPMIEAWRGDHLLSLMVQDVDRDEGLKAFGLVCAMQPSVVTFTTDTHQTQSPTNPKTGERWKEHEMQNLCDNEGACDTGVLIDALMSVAMTPDGHAAMWTSPYHIHEADRKVMWAPHEGLHFEEEPVVWEAGKEGVAAISGGEIQGLVADRMRQAFSRAPEMNATLTLLGNLTGFTDPQLRSMHRDAAMLHLIDDQGWAAKYRLPRDRELADIIRRAVKQDRLKRIVLIDP